MIGSNLPMRMLAAGLIALILVAVAVVVVAPWDDGVDRSADPIQTNTPSPVAIQSQPTVIPTAPAAAYPTALPDISTLPPSPTEAATILPDPSPEPTLVVTPGVGLPEEPECSYVKVELDEPAEQADLQRLAEAGLRLLERLEKRIWYACLTSDATTFQGVVNFSPISPDEKLSPVLKSHPSPFDWQMRPGGHVAYGVLFQKGVSAGNVRDMVARLGLGLEDFDAETFEFLRTATIIVPPEGDGLRLLSESGLVSWIEPSTPPIHPRNQNHTQPLSKVDRVQSGFNLDGSGVTVGIWEPSRDCSGSGVGPVMPDHVELAGRVLVEPGQESRACYHATHVAGTIGSKGILPASEGMAPDVFITSYSLGSLFQTFRTTATSTGGPGQSRPIQISNHSYGDDPGWSWDDGYRFSSNTPFGTYNNWSWTVDNVIYQTGFVAVWAAGNDRNFPQNLDLTATSQPNDCWAIGLGYPADCMPPDATPKNLFTIGAMDGSNGTALFSDYGPTDDGRIKPDLMAQGMDVFSPCPRSQGCTDEVGPGDSGYLSMPGTSMASPAVAGIGALILQDALTNMNSSAAEHFPFRRVWTPMYPEALKALLVQTAIDVKDVPWNRSGTGWNRASEVLPDVAHQIPAGPDYATGWGIVDAEAAVILLRQGGLVQGSIDAIGEPNAWTQTFQVQENETEVHMTLAWTDPPGNPAASKALVNDLDLELIAPDGTVHTPWRLGGMANPVQPAIRDGGKDSINNVEQVSVLNPGSGTWTVRVSASDVDVTTLPQRFAVAGLLPDDPSTIVSPIRLLLRGS